MSSKSLNSVTQQEKLITKICRILSDPAHSVALEVLPLVGIISVGIYYRSSLGSIDYIGQGSNTVFTKLIFGSAALFSLFGISILARVARIMKPIFILPVSLMLITSFQLVIQVLKRPFIGNLTQDLIITTLLLCIPTCFFKTIAVGLEQAWVLLRGAEIDVFWREEYNGNYTPYPMHSFGKPDRER